MKLKILYILLLTFCTQVTIAQVQFQTKLSKKKLALNERVRVDFEMNANGDNFTPPDFTGFDVVGGPNQAMQHSWVNGKKSFSKTFSYYLAPKRKGTITIKQATIEVDGEVYKTSPVQVVVTTSVDKPKDVNNNSDAVADDNLHLVAEVSKANPYLNEAITVVYKLYIGPGIRGISNYRELDAPQYNDFWSQAIDMKQLKVVQGQYKGEPYQYVVLRKTVLYPQKTGKLKIEPLTMSISVNVPTSRRSFFGNMTVLSTVDKTVAAGSRTINVKPLPTQGKPAHFSGAVGEFDFKVTPTRTEMDALESIAVGVTVSGKGNLKLINMPKLTVPNGIEQYEPEHDERVTTDLMGMSGTITDSYTLVPQYKGEYPIAPLSFSYFNPKTERYTTLASKPIVLQVHTGPDNVTANTGGTTTTGVTKQKVTQHGNQFRFIKSDTDLQPVERTYFFTSIGYWLALATPLLAIPLFLFFGKKQEERRSDVRGNRVRKADKLARKYLSEAKKSLGNQKEFYIAMERALHNYLKAKLAIETSDMSKDRIQRLLNERTIEQKTSIEFIALLESCEFARYTPSTTTGMQQDYDKASRVISALDKQL